MRRYVNPKAEITETDVQGAVAVLEAYAAPTTPTACIQCGDVHDCYVLGYGPMEPYLCVGCSPSGEQLAASIDRARERLNSLPVLKEPIDHETLQGAGWVMVDPFARMWRDPNDGLTYCVQDAAARFRERLNAAKAARKLRPSDDPEPTPNVAAKRG